MTATNYGNCLDHVFKFEGGYVDHPRDPGGATNMGITIGALSAFIRRRATKAEVKNLSRETAAMIYKRNYWNKVRGDDLPAGLDLVAFDAGVNSGIRRGAQWLQRAIGVAADGKIGKQTIARANAVSVVPAIQKACAIRMGFLQSLRIWSTFGRGWSRRVASVEATAISMHSKLVLPQVAKQAERDKGNAQKSAGATGAGGGAVAGLGDLPDIAVYGIIAATVVVAFYLFSRSRHHSNRVRAFKDIING